MDTLALYSIAVIKLFFIVFCASVFQTFFFFFSPGNQDASVLADEILEQENVLKQCIGQLENAEASRAALVSQLKEAIQEQVRLCNMCEFSSEQSYFII